ATEKVAQVPAPKSSPFSLRGGGSGFSSRSHSIFDCLDTMAKMTSSSLGQDNVIDSVFARPAPPPSRKTSHPPSASPIPAKKRGVPDYMMNPDRWTHYSLEDVWVWNLFPFQFFVVDNQPLPF
uniref:U5 small nuclear ribonucleoprotein TSSC4 n=1 Tax=Neogobius melanostomus TaxID=47308 RepID=A0A8C6SYK5_9GOBI